MNLLLKNNTQVFLLSLSSIFTVYHALLDGVPIDDCNAPEYALDNVSRSSSVDEADVDPLFWAVFNQDTEAVQRMIDQGADINKRETETHWAGCTPLMIATGQGHYPLVHLLLEAGADTEVRSTENKTALLYLFDIYLCSQSEKNRYALMELLVHKGACIDVQDDNGNTPLIGAIAGGYDSIVNFLIQHGASLEVSNNKGNTPLIEAIVSISSYRYRGLISLLLEHKAPIETRTPAGDTPLILAASRGSAELVELLLRYGADKSVCNKKGLPVWKIAHSAYSLGSMASWLESYEDVEHACPLRRFIIHPFICHQRNYALSKLLQDAEIPLNNINAHGDTPLMCAIYLDNVQIVRLLLERPEINPHIYNKSGYNALLLAVSLDRRSVIRALLAYTDININEGLAQAT